ncbi:MAG: 23S rRNA (uracil(1939)-C(5))-methyltransferase RlmD [Vicinamibacterales bacterium]
MTCAHFGICGGCSLQHITYPAQLAQRTGQFERATGLSVASPMIGMPVQDDGMPWAFRQKVSFVFGSDARENLVMGHYARGSKRIIPVRECPVHSARGNRIAFALRDRLAAAGIRAAGARRAGILRHVIVRSTRDDREAIAMLVVTRNDKALRAPVRALLASADRPDGFFININDKPGSLMVGERTIKVDGVGHVRENAVGRPFLISPPAFFQTNVVAAAHLVRLVTGAVSSARRVLDLFSGSGLFGVALAMAGTQVVAVEENRQSVKDAEANRRLNRIPEDRLRLINSSVEDALPRLARESFDAVVLDPPRDGCSLAVLSEVFGRLKPRHVVYVSCNPRALARELPRIVAQGYEPVTAQPVDMFPHTEHIEAVIVFTRKPVSSTARC